MGTALSTFILLTGSLVTGVTSSIAANRVSNKKWSQAKLYTGLSMGLQIALVLMTLFILVKSHIGAGEITGVIESMAFGVMFSFIFLMLCMTGSAVLNGVALVGEMSDNPEKSNAFRMSVGAAIINFGSFVLSLFIIIFLL